MNELGGVLVRLLQMWEMRTVGKFDPFYFVDFIEERLYHVWLDLIFWGADEEGRLCNLVKIIDDRELSQVANELEVEATHSMMWSVDVRVARNTTYSAWWTVGSSFAALKDAIRSAGQGSSTQMWR